MGKNLNIFPVCASAHLFFVCNTDLNLFGLLPRLVFLIVINISLSRYSISTNVNHVTFPFENTLLCTPKVATLDNLKQVRFPRLQPKAQNKAEFKHVWTMDCDHGRPLPHWMGVFLPYDQEPMKGYLHVVSTLHSVSVWHTRAWDSGMTLQSSEQHVPATWLKRKK